MLVLYFLVGLLSIVSFAGILYLIGSAVKHYLLEDNSNMHECGIGFGTLAALLVVVFTVGLVLVVLTMLGELILKLIV